MTEEIPKFPKIEKVGISISVDKENLNKLKEYMEADHIDPWHDGGHTTADNCQMLCKHDNRVKSGK